MHLRAIDDESPDSRFAGDSPDVVLEVTQGAFVGPTIERLADVAPHVATALGIDVGAVRRVLALVRDALVEEPQLGVTECELAAALRRRL